MAGIGNLVANLTANTSGFTKGINAARGQLASFASFASASMASFAGNVGASAFTTLTSSLKSLGTSALSLASDNEQTAISFEVMLGSASDAQAMLSQMKSFAASTPFEFTDISEAGKTLLQFGVNAGNVLPALRMLGDVSGGNADRFKSLATVFGQVSATGRLMGGDLLQFINAGFNPLQEISKRTGESMASLKAKMEAGGISADMVAESFTRATSQGGQFFGMMDRQSGTTAGLFSTLKDNVNTALGDIGAAIIQGFNFKGLISDTSSFLEVFRSEWLPGIVGVINTAGGMFQRLIEGFRSGWGQWLISSVQGLASFVGNVDIYFQFAQQSIVLWAANAINQFDALWQNVGVGLEWFSNNWKEVLSDIGNAAIEAFKSILDNYSVLFLGVKKIKLGEALNPDFKPVESGFKSSIKEMPKWVSAAVADSTPELDALGKELARRQMQNIGGGTSAAVTSAAPIGEFQLSGQGAAEKATKAAASSIANAPGLALKGTKEALSNIFAANRVGGTSRDPQTKLVNVAEQQLAETRKQTQQFDKLIGEQMKGGGMVAIPL